jgi:hypothetical protein
MTLPTSSGPGFPPSGDPELSSRDRLREQLSDKRVLALLGVALLGVVLLAAFVVLPALTSKSSNDDATPPVVHHAVQSATTSPSATPSALPTVNAAIQLRDPFVALVSGSAASGGGAGASSVSASTSGQSTSTAAPTTAPTLDPTKIQFAELALVKITPSATQGDSTASVTVNGLSYTVQVGQAFASGFTLTALTATTATFSYGEKIATLVPGQFALFGTTS